jgi:hypothetical protein
VLELKRLKKEEEEATAKFHESQAKLKAETDAIEDKLRI